MNTSTSPQPSQLSVSQRPLRRNRDFLLLWSGQIVSTTGSNVSALALPLLVLALTQSPMHAGLVAATQFLPHLLFSLPTGALLDRWDRKAVMIYSDLVCWLVLGSVPLAFVLGYLSIPQLYLVAFIEGTASVFFSLAQISALPRVVPPIQISRAYAVSEITESSSSLIGPNLSALIIYLARNTITGAIISYLLNSISYLISMIALRFIRTPFQVERSQEEKRSLWQEILAGLRFLWQQPLLRLMALLTMVNNFFQAWIPLAIILLSQDHLHLDVTTLGVIVGSGGFGGLLGGLIASWLKERFRFGQIIIASLLIWAGAIALMAPAWSPLPLIIGRGLVGLIWPVYAVTLVTYRLSLAPDEFQGRVNSTFRFLTYGIEPVGAAIGGLLLVPLGPRLELGIAVVALALSALFVSFTRLRRA